MRAFVCLTVQSDDGTVESFGICAPDRASALAVGTATVTNQTANPSRVVGILTQEEVTGMGMLLAAGRAGLSARSSIKA